MEKTLKTIQTLSKVGKILSKIVFIFSIIGIVGCLAGIICLAAGLDGSVKIDGVTIHSIIEKEADTTVGNLYASLAVGLVLSVCECILARFAEQYFKHELKAGTPFTLDGAAELKRLGILSISLALGGSVLAAIVHTVMEHAMEGVEEFKGGDVGSISLGIMFLVMSLVLRYGTERIEKTNRQE